ncbi:HesA/MoeB/ThiF family protein [Vibrio sp. ZSDE26]|uniref:HesA/MoeB/ThiF family protein n=1 Tax=Vibrio amylolyticus TaxID=2847292 RepID=A0A9X1XP66_9VIBR|nr:HesA/MoeB/ThiF family protein [Vibrio amylolyticus]
MLTDQEFIRYQRQVSLPGFGEQGQKNLKNAQVLLIGCGGLGSAAAMYLASAGIGRLVIVDDDAVESSNLQRQVIYRDNDIGKDKAQAMAKQIERLNSDCRVRAIKHRFEETQLSLEVGVADIVLDCTDNFMSRHLINKVCFFSKTPLVSGAAIGWQGQFIVFNFDSHSACYHCLYPADEFKESMRCSDMGIIGPVVGTIGNLQALATIQKIVLGEFKCTTEALQLFDGSSMTWKNLSLNKVHGCRVCGEFDKEESFSATKQNLKR